MMDCFSGMSMSGMWWMMAAGGVFWVLVLALLILAIAGLIKYLRSDRSVSPRWR
jgi:hypothetical protein